MQFRAAARLHRHELERQRREEISQPLVGDDQDLPGARDVRCGQSCEPALRCARTWIPGSTDGGERAPQRRLEPAVQPLDPTRLEVDATDRGRIDRKTGVFECTQDLFPRLLGCSRILLHQNELRTRRQPLAEPHPRADTEPLGHGRDRAEHRLRSGHRRQCCGSQGEARLLAQGSPQLEAGDEKAGDHGNVCSTRTPVRLSRGSIPWL